MDTNKPLSIFLVAILAASVFSVIGITAIPLQKASAQAATIETSADDNGGTFFGEAMLRVVIEDEDTDDADDTISVDISVDGGDPETFPIPDTNDGSQRFEFFLVHEDAADLDPADPEAAAATVITFGPTGDIAEDVALYEDGVEVEISYGDLPDVTIDYEESSAELELDRDLYGTSSLVYVRIVDQDANLDPTDAGTVDILAADLNDVVFELEGAEFATDLSFEETGDNTAVFEAEAVLGEDITLTSEAVQLTLNDKATYADLDNAANTSVEQSEVTFTVDNEDGEMDPIGSVTMGSEIKITVRDNDRNEDSDGDESLDGVIRVTSENDEVILDLEETEDNSGVFVIDLPNNELRVSFVPTDGADDTNTILELEPGDTTEDIVIEYYDVLTDDEDFDDFEEEAVDFDDPGEAITSRVTTDLTIVNGNIELPETAGVNDDVTITLTDADLNDNPRTRDSYTVSLEGDDEAEYGFFRGEVDLTDQASLEVEVEGDTLEFGAEDVGLTFIETGANTGIFEASLDMAELIADAGLDVEDGDEVEFTYVDKMGTIERDSADALTIGRADAGVSFSRDVLPIPPDDAGVVAGALGSDTVLVTLLVSDPDENENSNVEDTIDVVIGEDANEFTIEIDGEFGGATINNDGDPDTDDEIDADEEIPGTDGITLEDILVAFEGEVLEETGPNTGVFELELEFVRGGLDAEDWHDMVATITYTDASDETESDGITFRGNDAFMEADADTVTTAGFLTVTIQDEDLNLDDGEIEEFESSFDVGDLLSVEAEDEDIAADDQGATVTFEETGENTGIFTAEFEIGTDIIVTLTDPFEQASNIHMEFVDETDAGGEDGDEIELDVAVVTSTGAIHVTPELVGPGTEVTVQIVDSDLNRNPSASDDYDGETDADPAELGDAIEVQSDRDEAEGDENPGLEETAPNSGVFEFTIQLIPGDDCADDGGIEAATVDGNEMEIGACPGDLIAISYEDEVTADGRTRVVSSTVEVQSWDPEFLADKESYAVGDRVTVTISDPDANRDSDVADTLRDITVSSQSDVVGEEISALETGKDTGVFRLSFTLTEDVRGGGINARSGDSVTVEYTDEFPADFADEEDDKDFEFTFVVGGVSGPDTTEVTPPQLQDVTGRVIDELSAGQQVVLTTNVENNNDTPQPFVALIEVRDSNGVTIFLAWQTGTLPANGETQVGLSWTPDIAGDYTVRTFVISDLANPQVLSTVSDTDITVS